MRLIFKPSGVRGLRKLPREVQGRILDKLEFYAEQEDPLEFGAPLVSFPRNYRFRIGEWRAIFRVQGEAM